MTTEPRIDATIADVAYGGAGVARHDGLVVFVPGVLIGERVGVEIARRHKQYADGTAVEILDPSPARVAPFCALAAQCPGCAYQHMHYEEELRVKQAQFAGFLTRQAGISEPTCLPPVGSPCDRAYRNKIVLHADVGAGAAVLGYVGRDNASIIDIPTCPLAAEPINDLLSRLRAAGGLMSSLKDKVSVTLRHTRTDGAVYWFGGTRSAGRPDRKRPIRELVDLTGVDMRPFGRKWLEEDSIAGPLAVPRDGFFQVNAVVADLLWRHVEEVLRQTAAECAVDAYCGAGVFALIATRAGIRRCVGIDEDAASIQAARKNAARHGAGGVEFVAGPVAHLIDGVLRKSDPSRTALIVDPPRRGLDPGSLASIVSLRPAHLIYVSCAADTLARDLKALTASGYVMKHAKLFDMFPRTPYFESVACLVRE